MSNTLPKFIDRSEVASKLGISVKTVDRWIAKGMITAKRIPGTRRVLIPEHSVTNFLVDVSPKNK